MGHRRERPTRRQRPGLDLLNYVRPSAPAQAHKHVGTICATPV